MYKTAAAIALALLAVVGCARMRHDQAAASFESVLGRPPATPQEQEAGQHCYDTVYGSPMAALTYRANVVTAPSDARKYAECLRARIPGAPSR